MNKTEQKLIEKQKFIENLADIDYTCYTEKLSLAQFWNKRLGLECHPGNPPNKFKVLKDGSLEPVWR